MNRQNQKEDIPKTFKGKQYDAYGARQKQRNMETAMRAQREKVQLLKEGGADPDDVMLARCKYQGQLDEYAKFCKKMDLTQERERIYMDMRGRVAPDRGIYQKNLKKVLDKESAKAATHKTVAKASDSGIIKETSKVFEGKNYVASIKSEELKIRNNNIETAVILDGRGNVIFKESSGASNYVQFTEEQLDKMEGMSLTHNHPSNSTFSSDDVVLLVNRRLKIIRATGTDRTYQLKQHGKVNDEFADEYKDEMTKNKTITDAEYEKLEKKFNKGDVSYSEFQDKCGELNKKLNKLNSEWLKENAKNYGYRYSVIERRK